MFALSTTLWLSLVALFALGAFDMVSMVIRGALVQLDTPDDWTPNLATWCCVSHMISSNLTTP